ncbi:MAG TPA: nuclear transport factor 2 family protein [Steroidobacteraceae bacterium]|nr:nuclear transport factor 2 family protein [Steroidobacteraceae bacterium]
MKRLAATLLLLCIGMPALADNYAEDRARIEDLMGRYLFSMDWQDAEGYASTFTEDGVLIYGGGEQHGRKALREMIETQRASTAKRRAEDKSGLRPARGRHSVTNIVVEINGNTAKARAYWTVLGNSNPQRSASVGAYGHYEDDLVKQDGKWLFKKRQVFNEQLERRAATDKSPLKQ